MDLGFIRLVEEHREELWTGLGDFSKVFTQAGAVSRASLTHGSAGTKGRSTTPPEVSSVLGIATEQGAIKKSIGG